MEYLLLLQSTMLSPSFEHLLVPFPLPGVPLFQTPGMWHVYSLLNLNVPFFFGRLPGILDLVTHPCYMPPGAVIIWEVQIIVFM